jgi:hypothetical protein
MNNVEELLAELYNGQQLVDRDEICRRAVALDVPVDVVAALGRLPEGDHTRDEVAKVLTDAGRPTDGR